MDHIGAQDARWAYRRLPFGRWGVRGWRRAQNRIWVGPVAPQVEPSSDAHGLVRPSAPVRSCVFRRRNAVAARDRRRKRIRRRAPRSARALERIRQRQPDVRRAIAAPPERIAKGTPRAGPRLRVSGAPCLDLAKSPLDERFSPLGGAPARERDDAERGHERERGSAPPAPLACAGRVVPRCISQSLHGPSKTRADVSTLKFCGARFRGSSPRRRPLRSARRRTATRVVFGASRQPTRRARQRGVVRIQFVPRFFANGVVGNA